MIPYDDLVVALSAWRSRQGLPVAQPPTPAPVRAVPAPTPRAASAPAVIHAGPAPVDDFDEGSLVEEAPYDSGDDYVLPLGGHDGAIESTAIGAAPEPPKRW